MKPFKSIREGNSVEPGVSEINDVPEDPMSYVEIKPKKSKVVKEASELGDLAHEKIMKHRFLVTYTDPNHTMASMRKEKQQKHVLVPATHKGETVYTGDAEPLVKKHMKKQGYKVHSMEHVGMVSKKVYEDWVQHDVSEGAFSSGALKPTKELETQASKVPSTGTIRGKDEKGVYTAKTVNGKEVSRVYEETVQVEEGKKPEHNLGVGWMLDKDKELGQKVAQNKARSINRAMNATPRKPDTEYDRKVTSYLKKKYNESIDISGIWESLKPEPVVEAFDAEAHKKELDRLMTKHMNAHAETTRLIKAKASQEEIDKAQERNNAVKDEIRSHKAKVPAGPAPKPGSAAHYYASKKPGEYTGD